MADSLSSIPWHAIFAFLIPPLGMIVQMHYPSSSPLDQHPANMWIVILCLFLYVFALGYYVHVWIGDGERRKSRLQAIKRRSNKKKLYQKVILRQRNAEPNIAYIKCQIPTPTNTVYVKCSIVVAIIAGSLVCAALISVLVRPSLEPLVFIICLMGLFTYFFYKTIRQICEKLGSNIYNKWKATEKQHEPTSNIDV